MVTQILCCSYGGQFVTTQNIFVLCLLFNPINFFLSLAEAIMLPPFVDICKQNL